MNEKPFIKKMLTVVVILIVAAGSFMIFSKMVLSNRHFRKG